MLSHCLKCRRIQRVKTWGFQSLKIGKLWYYLVKQLLAIKKPNLSKSKKPLDC